jgi:hypothetical protein
MNEYERVATFSGNLIVNAIAIEFCKAVLDLSMGQGSA